MGKHFTPPRRGRPIAAPHLTVRGGRYFITFNNNDGRGTQHAPTGVAVPHEDDALAVLARWEERNRHRHQPSHKHTVRDCWMRYKADKERKEYGSLDEKAREWKTRLEPELGDVLVCDLTPDFLVDFINRMRECRTRTALTYKAWEDKAPSENTIARIIDGLFAILNHCANVRMIDARDVPKLSSEERPEIRVEKDPDYWELEDAQAMLDRVAERSPPEGEGKLDRLHLFVWLALLTGARCRAILHTRAEMVDLRRARIRWKDAYERKGSPDRRCKNDDTRKHAVNAEIYPETRPELLALLERAVREAPKRGDNLKRPEDWLFDSDARGYTNLRRDWYAFLDEIGVKRGRIHMARHTFATLYIKAGATADDVARHLGNSVLTVLRTYDHALNHDRREMLGLVSWLPREGQVVPLRRRA